MMTILDDDQTLTVQSVRAFRDFLHQIRDDFPAGSIAQSTVALVIDSYNDFFEVGPWD